VSPSLLAFSVIPIAGFLLAGITIWHDHHRDALVRCPAFRPERDPTTRESADPPRAEVDPLRRHAA
jgi:hypothetical protein